MTVDGRVVSQMGVKVDVGKQDVRCDGVSVRTERHVYYLLNKPAGVVCTTADPQGRRRAIDLIPGIAARAYTVGRLDADTDGLVIVTNDGELTQRVAHPRYQVPKTYRAWVRGAMNASTPKALLAGVMLDGRRCRATAASIVRAMRDKTLVELTLVEGRKHEVRRMLKHLNHPVERLTRIAIGPIRNEHLASGQHRVLKAHEVAELKSFAPPRPHRKGRTQRGARAPRR